MTAPYPTTPPAAMTFDEARARVRSGQEATAVARSFVSTMTVEEKLWCLDGDDEFWSGLMRLAGGPQPNVAGDGYGRSPWLAAQLPERNFPGIAFSDGPR